ncbi:hypothetical protein FS842_008352 [Serendipita sp. 407]|nr:hypothetical protein FS842_008352 [Serendipita sp. 407]
MDEGLTPENPITLGGVQKLEFEALLTILYQGSMAPPEALPLETMITALRQAVERDFTAVAHNISLALQRKESTKADKIVTLLACCAEHHTLFIKESLLRGVKDICLHSDRPHSGIFARLDHFLLSAIVAGREVVREHLEFSQKKKTGTWVLRRETYVSGWNAFECRLISRLPDGGPWV